MKIKLQRGHAKTLATARTLDENYRGTIRGAGKVQLKASSNWTSLTTLSQKHHEYADENISLQKWLIEKT